MICRVALCLAAVMVLLAPMPAKSQIPDIPASGGASSQNAQDVRLMQQADHQRRLMEEPEATLAIDENGVVTPAEGSSEAGIDIAVIAVMAVSGLAFLVVCRLRGNSLRQCIRPRRIHRSYLPGNSNLAKHPPRR